MDCRYGTSIIFRYGALRLRQQLELERGGFVPRGLAFGILVGDLFGFGTGRNDGDYLRRMVFFP